MDRVAVKPLQNVSRHRPSRWAVSIVVRKHRNRKKLRALQSGHLGEVRVEAKRTQNPTSGRQIAASYGTLSVMLS